VFAVDSYSKCVYAIEVKSSTRRRVEVKRHQLRRLRSFLRGFRALARECVALVCLYSFRVRRWTVYELRGDVPSQRITGVAFRLDGESWVPEEGGGILNRGYHAQLVEKLLNATRRRPKA